MPERASDAALDMALRPFVERFVKEDKRSRAATMLAAKHGRIDWHDVLQLIDLRRGSTYSDADLEPWHAVRGVFLVGNDAFALDAKTAFGLYVTEPSLFVAYGATFAVTRDAHGHSLLLT